ncbi:DUF952 domain-containing protein [Demequina flava]|uniref:DUF952 domain-containing protein n=1 Tax=Demequina flava TaxID=1095025 RepID=UPI000783450C|nr:DUF952 domain-containing protein [Demequina flava]
MSIYHLAHVADWTAAVNDGRYTVSTRGADLAQVGFIHASHAHQVSTVAEFLYADDPEELCVLEVDTEAAIAAGVELIEEDGGEGEFFPHIYGAIDPNWVTRVWPARFADGRFIWG